MAIDWAKVNDAADLSSRARALQEEIDRADARTPKVVRLSENPDLDIPFTAALRTLYEGRRDSLMQQAKQKLAEA